MPANTTPIFSLTPVFSGVDISTANTSRDGYGTVGTVITAGTNGTRITRVTVRATGTTTAGNVRLFIYTGSYYMYWREVAVVAITPTASTQSFNATVDLPGEYALILPNGYTLVASTHNAEHFHVSAEGGNY